MLWPEVENSGKMLFHSILLRSGPPPSGRRWSSGENSSSHLQPQATGLTLAFVLIIRTDERLSQRVSLAILKFLEETLQLRPSKRVEFSSEAFFRGKNVYNSQLFNVLFAAVWRTQQEEVNDVPQGYLQWMDTTESPVPGQSIDPFWKIQFFIIFVFCLKTSRNHFISRGSSLWSTKNRMSDFLELTEQWGLVFDSFCF